VCEVCISASLPYGTLTGSLATYLLMGLDMRLLEEALEGRYEHDIFHLVLRFGMSDKIRNRSKVVY
jgi:hypothetical protein